MMFLKVLLLFLNLLFIDLAIAQCSKDQAKVLVEALFDFKKREWKKPLADRSEVQKIVHELLFNQETNIREEQRTSEQIAKAEEFFEKIQGLLSLRESDGSQGYLEQLRSLNEFFKNEGKSNLVEKQSVVDSYLKEQPKREKLFEDLFEQREIDFTIRFEVALGRLLRLKTGKALRAINYLSKTTNPLPKESKACSFISEFHTGISQNSLFWTSWLHSVRGSLLRDYSRFENRAKLEEFRESKVVKEDFFIETLKRRLRAAKVDQYYDLNRIDLSTMILLDQMSHFANTRDSVGEQGLRNLLEYIKEDNKITDDLSSGQVLSLLLGKPVAGENQQDVIFRADNIYPLVEGFLGVRELPRYQAVTAEAGRVAKARGKIKGAIGKLTKAGRKLQEEVNQRASDLKDNIDFIVQNVSRRNIIRQELQRFQLDDRFTGFIDLLLNNMENGESWSSWAKDLHAEVMREYHLPKNKEKFEKYKADFKVDRQVLQDVLLRRSMGVGFSNYIHVIPGELSTLSAHEFSSILRQGKLLIDQPLEGTSHGGLIHIFQIDYMIHLARENNVNPKIVLDFYKYMGRMRDIGNGRQSIHLWDLFFDAYVMRTFGRGVFQPEVINPSIERFFGLRQ